MRILRLLVALCVSVSVVLPVFATGQRETAADEADVTLRFTYWGSPAEAGTIVSAIEGFEEAHPNIDVQDQNIPFGDYVTKLTAMLAGGDEPDVAFMPPAQAYPWAREGELYNIAELLADDPDMDREDFLSSIWYDWAPGKSLGTNSAVEAFGIFYNKSIFEETGVDRPPTTANNAWSWEQFVDVAKQLTLDREGRNANDPDFDPESIQQYGVEFGTWWGPWFAIVQANGGDYISEDGTEFTLADPEAVEAIQLLADLIHEHHVAPSPVQRDNLPGSAIALQTERVAMTINGQWILPDLVDADFDFGIGVLPRLARGSTTLVLGSPTVIFQSTDHPEEAWMLYKWLANPETAIDLIAGGTWMPLMRSWYEDSELVARWAEGNPAHPPEYKDAIMRQALENGIPGPEYYVVNFGELGNVVNPALERVWLGNVSAEEALANIREDAQGLVEGRYPLSE